MFTAASTTSLLSTAFTDTGTILAAVLATVIAAVIGLMGLNFGIKRVKKYITGGKF